MLRNVMFYVVLGLGFALNAGASGERQRIGLAGDWDFQFVKEAGAPPGDAWGRIKQPSASAGFGEGQAALHLRKSVTVPETWRGRRVVFNPGKIAWGAKVSVDGKPAGEIVGYERLDLTPHINYGATNTLQLHCPKYGKGLAALDPLARYLSEWAERNDNYWMRSRTGFIGPSASLYLESCPNELEIEDVWYKTYVSGGKRIEPEIAIRSARVMEAPRVRIEIADNSSGLEVLAAEFPVRRLVPGENAVTVQLEAGALKLWDLHEPNLYKGRAAVIDSKGETLDLTAWTVFGLREIRRENKHIMLNNHKLPIVAMPEQRSGGVTVYLETGRTFPGEFIFSDVSDEIERCDQAGLPCLVNGVNFSIGCDLDFTDPNLVLGMRQWLKHHTRHFRNHPAVFAYSVASGGVGGRDPDKIGRDASTLWQQVPANRSHLLHNEFDPTRLTLLWGASAVPSIGSTMIYFNHTPAQEIEDWLEIYDKLGDKPFWGIEFYGAPLPQDYQKGVQKGVNQRRAYVTEYLARVNGDSAYAAESDGYLRFSSLLLPLQSSIWQYDPSLLSPAVTDSITAAHRRGARMWRYYNAGIMPFIFDAKYNLSRMPATFLKEHGVPPESFANGPAAIFDDCKRMTAADQAWIAGPPDEFTGKEHVYRSGEAVEKSIGLIRDRTGADDWRMEWRVMAKGTPVAQGVIERTLGPFARENAPFSFQAPEVAARTEASIELTVTNKKTNTPVATDTMPLTFLPKSAGLAEKRWTVAVIDPKGDTTAELKKLGVAVKPYAKGDKLLILGREALQESGAAFPFDAEDVRNGLRVLVFEQHCAELGCVGFRHEDRTPRQAFVRMPSSPVFQGLDNALLRDWRGAGTLVSDWEYDRHSPTRRMAAGTKRASVATSVIQTPHFGSFASLADCEFDLAYSPLLSWRHGKGEIVFCQFDVTRRGKDEPAAALLTENLLAYLKNPSAAAQAKTALGLDAKAVDAILAQGFAAEALGERQPDPAQHVLVVSGAAPNVLDQHQKMVTEFLDRGGDALALFATLELLQHPLFNGVKTAVKTMTRAGTTVEPHELLAGVGPQNIHWRDPLSFNVLSSADQGFTSLLSGLLGVARKGKGRLILLQTDPETVRDLASIQEPPVNKDNGEVPISKEWRERHRVFSLFQLRRLNSLVLGNLGLASSPRLVERLLAARPAPEAPLGDVNNWVFLGLIPTASLKDPIGRGFDTYLAAKNPAQSFEENGRRIEFTVPVDSQSGLGIGGHVDMASRYGIHLQDTVVAFTQIWSTRARKAKVGFGADWWAVVHVNGKEVFRTISVPEKRIDTFGVGMANRFQVELKPGWNQVAVVLASGLNGFFFDFKMSDPGDLRSVQSLTAPDTPPVDIPPTAKLIDESKELPKGIFSLYSAETEIADDPYLYIQW